MERENHPLDMTPEHVLGQSGGRPLRLPPQPYEGIMLAGSQEWLGQPPTKIYYKTKLCEKFEINGHCMYGDRCTFAHGSAELRHPSLATHSAFELGGTVCYNFRNKGTCHYGEKCVFHHGFAQGLTIRNPGEMRSEIPLARAALGRAFPSVPAPLMHDLPRQMPKEQEGDAKVSNLERLSRKKTSGIYGDWPEQY